MGQFINPSPMSAVTQTAVKTVNTTTVQTTDLGNVSVLPLVQVVNGYFELTPEYTVATRGATGTIIGGFIWSCAAGGVNNFFSPNPSIEIVG